MQEFTLLTRANLMKLLRALRSIFLLWVPGLACVFFIGLMIYQTGIFDEEPLQEVVEIEQQISDAANAPLPAADDNAFYALMGLSASSNQDMIETGRQLVVRYLNNRDNGEDMLSLDDYGEILNTTPGSDNPWRQFERCNPRLEFNCLETMSQSLQVNPGGDQRLTVMLQRYENILQMRNFGNIADISIGTPVPAYQVFFDLGKRKIAELYSKASTAEFLKHLAAETAFWRFILREGTWPLDKMVAASTLWTDFLLLSEYLSANTLSAEDAALIASMLNPLTSEEMSLEKNYLNEARQHIRWINNGTPRTTGNWSTFLKQRLSYYLTQKNAAKNQAYATVTIPLLQMNALSAEELAETFQNQSFGIGVVRGPLRCRNCINYIASMHDLNGIISLLQLQLDLKTNDSADIPTAIANAAFTNPYTGEPFDYDPATGLLSFACLVAQFDGQCRVRISD